MPQVKLEPSGRVLEVKAGESVLAAALRQGVALPYGCRNGACRSCRARILEGRVHYPDGPPKALQPSDHDDGFVLLCAAGLRGDARIEVEELDAQGDIVVRTLLCRLRRKRSSRTTWSRCACTCRRASGCASSPASTSTSCCGTVGGVHSRSRAHPPGRPSMELQIRHVPGGEFSGYAFEHLKPRAILHLHGPLGSFYLRKSPPRPAVLMAGGPVSLPSRASSRTPSTKATRTPCTSTGGCAPEGTSTTTRSPGAGRESTSTFHYTPVLSEPWRRVPVAGPNGAGARGGARGPPGSLGLGRLLERPAAMVSAARRALVAQGLDPTCLHSDSFDYAFETGHDGL